MVRKVRGADNIKFKSLKDFIEVYNKYISILQEYECPEEQLIAFNLEMEAMGKYEIASLKNMDQIFKTFSKNYGTDMNEVSYVDLVQKYKLDVTKTFTYSTFIRTKQKIKDKKVEIKVVGTKERVKTVYGVPVPDNNLNLLQESLNKIEEEKIEMKPVQDPFEKINNSKFNITLGMMCDVHDDFEVYKSSGISVESIIKQLIENYGLYIDEFSMNHLYIRIHSFKELFGIPDGYIINGSKYFKKLFKIEYCLEKQFIKSFIDSMKVNDKLIKKAVETIYVPANNFEIDDEIIDTPVIKTSIDNSDEKIEVAIVDKKSKEEEFKAPLELEPSVSVNNVDPLSMKINELLEINTNMNTLLKSTGFNTIEELEIFIQDYKKVSKKISAIEEILNS